MRALKAVCGAAALVVCLAPGAHADEWNKKAYLTFSGPVQIPGATLPAGTYTFELADPDMARHVIRVSEKDSGKHVGLFMTIPNQRMEAPDDNLIMFAERPAGSPQAIHVWFYPGDRTGEEFVDPRSQAVKIAKANRKPVLAVADESNGANASEADRMAAMKGVSVGRVDERGNMTKDDGRTASTTAAPANTVDGSRESRAQAQSTTAQAPAATTAPRSANADRGHERRAGQRAQQNGSSSSAAHGKQPRTVRTAERSRHRRLVRRSPAPDRAIAVTIA